MKPAGSMQALSKSKSSLDLISKTNLDFTLDSPAKNNLNQKTFTGFELFYVEEVLYYADSPSIYFDEITEQIDSQSTTEQSSQDFISTWKGVKFSKKLNLSLERCSVRTGGRNIYRAISFIETNLTVESLMEKLLEPENWFFFIFNYFIDDDFMYKRSKRLKKAIKNSMVPLTDLDDPHKIASVISDQTDILADRARIQYFSVDDPNEVAPILYPYFRSVIYPSTLDKIFEDLELQKKKFYMAIIHSVLDTETPLSSAVFYSLGLIFERKSNNSIKFTILSLTNNSSKHLELTWAKALKMKTFLEDVIVTNISLLNNESKSNSSENDNLNEIKMKEKSSAIILQSDASDSSLKKQSRRSYLGNIVLSAASRVSKAANKVVSSNNSAILINDNSSSNVSLSPKNEILFDSSVQVPVESFLTIVNAGFWKNNNFSWIDVYNGIQRHQEADILAFRTNLPVKIVDFQTWIVNNMDILFKCNFSDNELSLFERIFYLSKQTFTLDLKSNKEFCAILPKFHIEELDVYFYALECEESLCLSFIIQFNQENHFYSISIDNYVLAQLKTVSFSLLNNVIEKRIQQIFSEMQPIMVSSINHSTTSLVKIDNEITSKVRLCFSFKASSFEDGTPLNFSILFQSIDFNSHQVILPALTILSSSIEFIGIITLGRCQKGRFVFLWEEVKGYKVAKELNLSYSHNLCCLENDENLKLLESSIIKYSNRRCCLKDRITGKALLIPGISNGIHSVPFKLGTSSSYDIHVSFDTFNKALLYGVRIENERSEESVVFIPFSKVSSSSNTPFETNYTLDASVHNITDERKDQTIIIHFIWKNSATFKTKSLNFKIEIYE